ncbi:unnamed protein product (macronuclear) [Paramecium tetraurelia]|uniref:Transmembrane protein n=1 Tax=Paramecium tetraurelia TaxID=5888 RepID=A0BVZ6_PARTE|nr:uncharacterized protein GSPATT00032565001 [Paramecium tetraurelia]CAK62713.1 unnamed protein product [Paramecium tetraurelia]|eukprot:XP_001430111.1 hypothetical protein (macronuclear) [Paramecium tetraurelia strain d4-2]
MNSKDTHIKCKQLIYNLQLHFKNGEVIKLDGYSTYCNRIDRSSSIISILIFAPLRVVKNNILYYSLSILSLILLTSIWSIDYPQYEFYFIFSFQLLAHVGVELYNKFKINGLDKKLNNQENKILKQWDECISNKEILKRIKQKAATKHKMDDVKERDRKISFKNSDNLQRQPSQRSRSSGCIAVVFIQCNPNFLDYHQIKAEPRVHQINTQIASIKQAPDFQQ